MEPITIYRPHLKTKLGDFLRAKQTASAAKQERDFLERLRAFAGEGKLLRGSLVCFSYRAWSGRQPTAQVINAALAIELAHSGLLMHDDIMDNDDLRRGQPSMHRQYETMAAKRRLTNPAGFGISLALCGGDVALLLAFELLNQTDSPAARQLFTDHLLQTCGGQMQDVYLGSAAAEPSRQAIYDIMEQKTAGYTVALPLALGAALAGQSPAALRKLQALGTLIGTIFQIRDDELGMFGSPRQTGKPVGADIHENKKTLLRYYLMRRCTDSQRQKLLIIFGNKTATATDIRFVQELLRNHGIPQLIAEEIETLKRRATEQIEQLSASRPTEQTLRSLIYFCSQRQF